jgi:hypothetical protein
MREGAVETFIAPDGGTTIVEWFNMTSVYVIYEQRKPVRQFSVGVGIKPVFRFDAGSLKAIVRPFVSNTAKIVDLTSGQDIATLHGHSNVMTGAAFSPEGRHIVTSSRDHTIRLWDVMTGSEIGRLPDDRERGLPPIFTPDGKRLALENIDAQRTTLLNLDPVNFVPAHMRRDYVCRERLSGADTFSDAEMEDPVLRSRDDLRNPCRAFGPLALEFYTDLLGIGRPR